MRAVGGHAGRCAPSTPLARVTAALASALLVAMLALVPADAVPSQHPGELTATDVEDWLDGAVPMMLAREAIPGAAISVVHDGEVLAEVGYGMADLGAAGRAPVPMDPRRTLLRVGSISKVPVAIAVLQLVERGEIDLDAPITTYTDLAPAPRFDTPVTMRHLLTHTAGYEETLRDLFVQSPEEVPTPREHLIAQAPRQIFAPGTTPSYSNYGYVLAAQIVEEVSGQEVGSYLQQEVLAPMGMESATYLQPPQAPLDARVARAYPSSRAAPIGFELSAPWPSGSLSASAADMSALMLALLDREHSPVLAPGSLEAMFAPGLDTEQLGTRAQGRQMTLGLFEEDRHGHRILGHNGDLRHSHAGFQIYPEEGLGIFIGLNGSGVRPGSTTVLRHDLFNAFTDRYLPRGEEVPQTLPTSAAHAATAAGTYIPSRRHRTTFVRAYGAFQTLTVRAEGDALLISARTDASGAVVRMHETSPWVFEDAAREHRVAVEVDADGEVVAIGLVPAVTLLPAPAWHTPVLPTLVASLAILAIALVTWPVRAVLAARGRSVRGAGTVQGAGSARGAERPLEAVHPGTRLDALLQSAGMLAALPALGGMALWAVVGMRLMALTPIPDLMLRGAQALTLLGILGAVPSAWWAVRRWQRRAWWRASAGLLVVLAFGGVAVFALAGGLLQPDIRY